MKAVVITGASTGIGETTAKYLASHGFKVYGSVRKPEDGARLRQEIGGNFEPLIFDVTDEQAVHEAAKKVRADLNGQTLAGLVNNAGIAVPGPFLQTPLDKWRKQFEANVIGVVATTQAFAPLLGADLSIKGEPGRIVMISSVAGKRGNPFAGPYSASKHAVEGLSESLRREMLLFGIDVIVIGPGPIKTPIWGKGAAPDFSKLGEFALSHAARGRFQFYAEPRQEWSAAGRCGQAHSSRADRFEREDPLYDYAGQVPARDHQHAAGAYVRPHYRKSVEHEAVAALSNPPGNVRRDANPAAVLLLPDVGIAATAFGARGRSECSGGMDDRGVADNPDQDIFL